MFQIITRMRVYHHDKIVHIERQAQIAFQCGDYILGKRNKYSFPEKHKHQWCKVEEGFILNLEGKKKNTIAYDYNS